MKTVRNILAVTGLVSMLVVACTGTSTPATLAPNVETQTVPVAVAATPLAPTAVVAATPLAQTAVVAATPSLVPHRGGTITFANSADPDTLDPATTIAGSAWVVLANIYDGLIQLDYASPNIPRPTINGLAESYDIVDNNQGRIITFHLRKGVKFHDGTPWNAAAAEFNFQRWYDKSFKYYYPLANSTISSFLYEPQSYKVVDDYTFQVVLAKPDIAWLDWLSKAPTFFMVSPAAVMKYGNEEFANHGGGTGAFIVEEYTKNVRLVLQANPDYWQGAPQVDKLIFIPVPDDAARLAGLIAGEYDIAQEISPDSIPLIKASPGLTVVERGKPVTLTLGGNLKERPWSDPRVREAVSLAVDRVGICEKLLNGACLPATQWFGIGNEAYDPTLPIVDPYDLVKAKALLAEAGYPDGFKATLYTSTSAMGAPDPPRVFENIQSSLGKIGIQADLVVIEWNTYLGRWLAGVGPAAGEPGGRVPLWTEAGGWDTNQIFAAHVATKSQPPNGANYVWYSNPEVDNLLDESTVATNFDGMIVKLRAAQSAWMKDRPMVLIFQSLAPFGVNKRVHWTPAAAWSQNLRLAWVEP